MAKKLSREEKIELKVVSLMDTFKNKDLAICCLEEKIKVSELLDADVKAWNLKGMYEDMIERIRKYY